LVVPLAAVLLMKSHVAAGRVQLVAIEPPAPDDGRLARPPSGHAG
jgi:hypothetical protein